MCGMELIDAIATCANVNPSAVVTCVKGIVGVGGDCYPCVCKLVSAECRCNPC